MALTRLDENDSEFQIDYGMRALPGSRLQVRGPVPDFDAPFITVLGGTETFGKYVEEPYPALLEARIGMPVMNLGVAHAGLSLFSDEFALLDIAAKSEVTVLQVLGAQNMSNRLYSVHSRRNDRFLGVSPALRDIFPDVDFTDINFTGHLISTLRAASGYAFGVLVEELKWAWVQRMRRILSLIDGEVILLWISDRDPIEALDGYDVVEPQFVDAEMLADLQNDFSDIVKVVTGAANSLEGKVFSVNEKDAALCVPGPDVHERIVEALTPIVLDHVSQSGGAECAARA
ncbi:MAG: DUF6473 family protein [Pseudomonadota bacterium]